MNSNGITGLYGNMLNRHLTYKLTMRIYLHLSYLAILFVFSCSTDKPIEHGDIPVKLKSANTQLQLNFDSCLRLTQQLIKTQVSDKEFKEFFSLNKKATSFKYDYVVRHVSDSLSQLPKAYEIFYDFIYQSDTLATFRADFDSVTKNISYRKFHLLAFRLFLDKKLTVTRSEAAAIALNNGMKQNGLELIFKCSPGKFYWECKNDCEGCSFLDIDAKTGNIISQGKVVYQE